MHMKNLRGKRYCAETISRQQIHYMEPARSAGGGWIYIPPYQPTYLPTFLLTAKQGVISPESEVIIMMRFSNAGPSRRHT